MVQKHIRTKLPSQGAGVGLPVGSLDRGDNGRNVVVNRCHYPPTVWVDAGVLASIRVRPAPASVAVLYPSAAEVVGVVMCTDHMADASALVWSARSVLRLALAAKDCDIALKATCRFPLSVCSGKGMDRSPVNVTSGIVPLH